MQAPLGGCATPQLVGAVSQAGGLGILAASWTEPDLLRERIRLITRATDRPFCVNLVLEFEQASALRSLPRSAHRSSRSHSDSAPSWFSEAMEVAAELASLFKVARGESKLAELPRVPTSTPTTSTDPGLAMRGRSSAAARLSPVVPPDRGHRERGRPVASRSDGPASVPDVSGLHGRPRSPGRAPQPTRLAPGWARPLS